MLLGFLNHAAAHSAYLGRNEHWSGIHSACEEVYPLDLSPKSEMLRKMVYFLQNEWNLVILGTKNGL